MDEPESPLVVRGGAGPRRPHHFIQYREVQPLASEVTALAAYVLNHLLNVNHSASRYRKLGRLDLAWTDARRADHRLQLTFDDLVGHLRQQRTIVSPPFDLPPVECEWLDGFTSFAKPDAPIARADGSKFATFAFPMPFGPNFPITPALDREGAVYRSLQAPLMSNVVTLHAQLVAHSDRAPGLDMVWLNGLRTLLNDCVALVDVTLHQLYFMAKHRGAEFGWAFDEQGLGARHGMRLKDKLAWVGKITGRPLDNARDEVASLVVLKGLRNHLTHFDPPCFAYTMEDAVNWLDRVPDLGRLLWKMRDKMGAQLTPLLLQLVLLKPVAFVPADSAAPRVPQPPHVGYDSTAWPGLVVE